MKTLIGSKSRIIIGIALLFAVLSMSNGCTKSSMADMTGTGGDPGGSKGPGTNEVFIQDMAFNPSTITVAAGTTIKWTNKDPFAHTVTSDNGAFGSGTLATGDTFPFTFTITGSYPYHCTPHPTMTAIVIVN
jgi:plastocyanin